MFMKQLSFYVFTKCFEENLETEDLYGPDCGSEKMTLVVDGYVASVMYFATSCFKQLIGY